jgi:NAD(P)-dependent dehydrogenase (short-subunit alcohol dehydrogenase family)
VRLAGHCAVVTGAGSGLGRATAQALHAKGAAVALIDLKRESLIEAAAQLGERTVVCEADVRDTAQVNAAVTQARERFGAIHIAVSCAGISSSAKIVSGGIAHELEHWQRVIDINLTGTFNVMRLAAAFMVENTPDPETGERGVLVNTASIAGFEGQRGQAAYAASKAGVIGLTLPVARDLADKAIRCVAIAPGLFETPLFEGIPAKGVEALSRALLYPHRMGEPAEFADLVCHVIENRYLNGTCVRLDGGARLAL